jgi:signal peptidase I
VIESYQIPNPAPTLGMSPTLLPGDTLLVTKWTYLLSRNPQPKRGDVVVFSARVNSIKRVIGIEGDDVALKKGQLFLNGKTIAPEKNFGVDFETKKVPPGFVFVLGDTLPLPNLKNWGLIPISSLKGKALWIWLSIDPDTHHIRWNRMFRRIE